MTLAARGFSTTQRQVFLHVQVCVIRRCAPALHFVVGVEESSSFHDASNDTVSRPPECDVTENLYLTAGHSCYSHTAHKPDSQCVAGWQGGFSENPDLKGWFVLSLLGSRPTSTGTRHTFVVYQSIMTNRCRLLSVRPTLSGSLPNDGNLHDEHENNIRGRMEGAIRLPCVASLILRANPSAVCRIPCFHYVGGSSVQGIICFVQFLFDPEGRSLDIEPKLVFVTIYSHTRA